LSVPASAERPFAELLSEIAQGTPAPGAGSAAAWAGALAAALLEMTSAFAEAGASAERGRALRERLLESGEQELRSYQPVLAALGVEKSDPARAGRLAAALVQASESPLAIARAAAEVAELAGEVAARSKAALAGDAIAGVLLAEATARAAAHLVEINLRDHPDDPRLSEAAEASRRAASTRARVLGD
jgi:formiminotetrahydrofolate cyclodeaminase